MCFSESHSSRSQTSQLKVIIQTHSFPEISKTTNTHAYLVDKTLRPDIAILNPAPRPSKNPQTLNTHRPETMANDAVLYLCDFKAHLTASHVYEHLLPHAKVFAVHGGNQGQDLRLGQFGQELRSRHRHLLPSNNVPWPTTFLPGVFPRMRDFADITFS
jgi:hypothetical protein